VRRREHRDRLDLLGVKVIPQHEKLPTGLIVLRT